MQIINLVVMKGYLRVLIGNHNPNSPQIQKGKKRERVKRVLPDHSG